MKDVTIRSIEESDYEVLYQLKYGDEQPEWKKWDAPYFPLKPKTFKEFCHEMAEKRKEKVPMEKGIEVDGELIGTVSYYWEHKPSNWLEVGIVIYNRQYWNGGCGTKALLQWIDELFTDMPLVRVGLTTWSGNVRMMKCAEKLGMKLEGRLRKCRKYNGKYYDSIRMGILREEWEAIHGILKTYQLD